MAALAINIGEMHVHAVLVVSALPLRLAAAGAKWATERTGPAAWVILVLAAAGGISLAAPGRGPARLPARQRGAVRSGPPRRIRARAALPAARHLTGGPRPGESSGFGTAEKYRNRDGSQQTSPDFMSTTGRGARCGRAAERGRGHWLLARRSRSGWPGCPPRSRRWTESHEPPREAAYSYQPGSPASPATRPSGDPSAD